MDNFKVPNSLAIGLKRLRCLALPPAIHERNQGWSSILLGTRLFCLVPESTNSCLNFWVSGQLFGFFYRSVSPALSGAQKGARTSMHRPASSSSLFIWGLWPLEKIILLNMNARQTEHTDEFDPKRHVGRRTHSIKTQQSLPLLFI